MRKEFYEDCFFVKYNWCELCSRWREDDSEETQNTQILVFITGCACLKIRERKDINLEITAGQSLGKYSALVGSGALSFPDALTLVRKGRIYAGSR